MYLHCDKCGKLKSTSEFYQYKGLDNVICKQCLGGNLKSYHKKNMREHCWSCQCPDCQIDKINIIRDIKKILKNFKN